VYRFSGLYTRDKRDYDQTRSGSDGQNDVTKPRDGDRVRWAKKKTEISNRRGDRHAFFHQRRGSSGRGVGPIEERLGDGPIKGDVIQKREIFISKDIKKGNSYALRRAGTGWISKHNGGKGGRYTRMSRDGVTHGKFLGKEECRTAR